MTTEKRIKNVKVTREAFAEILKDGAEVVDGLPEDAECVQLAKDHDRDMIVATIRSDEWDLIREAEDIPIEQVRIE